MPDALAIRVKHHLGTFSLDAAFRIERWPAVLFGPSGAGKSTLLRVIAGLDRPDSASISLGEQPLTKPDGTIQLVAQRPALFPHLTVAQNVAFGLTHLPRSERHQRVDEMLTLLGAEHLADRMPIRLSGGERQRVAIARAIAPAPRLLLLDEAFAGLDINAKQQILAQLTALLEQRNIAALYVTHEASDAFALEAEVVVLRDGRVTAQGPARESLATEREQLLAALNPII
jgi:ABC-type sulfate/molybdate transport systems ATPase subunit